MPDLFAVTLFIRGDENFSREQNENAVQELLADVVSTTEEFYGKGYNQDVDLYTGPFFEIESSCVENLKTMGLEQE